MATSSSDPPMDFMTQLNKLIIALHTDIYVPPEGQREKSLEKYVIAPRMFKHLIGQGHREFSSNRQQDASEYFQHFLNLLERAENVGLSQRISFTNSSMSTAHLFRFQMEQRLQSCATGQVKYTSGHQTRQNILELVIPDVTDTIADSSSEKKASDESKLERKRQRGEKEEEGGDMTTEEKDNAMEEDRKPRISFEVCLQQVFLQEEIAYSFGGVSGTALRSLRFKTFPRYLMIKLGRYYVDENWTPRKRDVNISVPEELDLRGYRGYGLQESEIPMEENESVPLPIDSSTIQSARPQVDPALVLQIVSMGFSENGAKRALKATGNSSTDMALTWIFEHMEDADFNDPLPIEETADSAGAGGAGPMSIDPNAVDMLVNSIGCTAAQARRALAATGQDIER